MENIQENFRKISQIFKNQNLEKERFKEDCLFQSKKQAIPWPEDFLETLCKIS